MKMKVFEKLETLAQDLDIRDGNMVLTKIIFFMHEHFRCENVYWYRMGELQIEEGENRNRRFTSLHTLEETLPGFSPFLACKPFDVAELTDLQNQFLSQLVKGWEQDKNHEVYETDKYELCLIPVCSRDLGEVLGHVILQRRLRKQKFSDKEIAIVQRFVERQVTFNQQFEAAKSMSYMDTITALYNQRYLSIALDREVHRAERYKRPFSILFFDIDNFKFVNDHYGHLTGSAIITELGKVLKGIIRESDYGFRFGGDEFVLLLVETGVEDASLVAERVRALIEKTVFRVHGHEHQITVSVGVATCPDHGQSKEQILSLADKAMYHGKRTTKNTVYIAAS